MTCKKLIALGQMPGIAASCKKDQTAYDQEICE